MSRNDLKWRYGAPFSTLLPGKALHESVSRSDLKWREGAPFSTLLPGKALHESVLRSDLNGGKEQEET